MALGCSDIEKLINEIRLERHWIEDGKTEQFLAQMKWKWFSWEQQLIKLCYEKKYDDHEKVIKEIVELKAHIDDIFPKVCTNQINEVIENENELHHCSRLLIHSSSMYLKWDLI